jgi:uncharacterized protein
MDVRVVDNPEQLRYELWLGATRAGFIQYRFEPDTILIVLSILRSSPPSRARGWGLALLPAPWTTSVPGLTVVALCPFVRAYLRHHREYADLVARGPAVRE